MIHHPTPEQVEKAARALMNIPGTFPDKSQCEAFAKAWLTLELNKAEILGKAEAFQE